MTLDNETLKIAGDLAFRVWMQSNDGPEVFEEIYRRILNVIIDVQRPSVTIERVADAHKIREQGLEAEITATEIMSLSNPSLRGLLVDPKGHFECMIQWSDIPEGLDYVFCDRDGTAWATNAMPFARDEKLMSWKHESKRKYQKLYPKINRELASHWRDLVAQRPVDK